MIASATDKGQMRDHKSPTDPDTQNLPPDSTMILEKVVVPETGSSLHARLVVLSGLEIGREFPIGECPVVAGRAETAGISFNAPSVSRRHAEIHKVSDGESEFFTITDLGSSNGTLVNGAPADHTPLRNGDRVQMGTVLLKFVIQDEVDAQFHQQVHRLIHYDQLTGLLIMEAFRRRLDNAINRVEPGGSFTLAMTDLDGLKKVNDTYGHLAGRMVVKEMGSMIRRCLRDTDLAGLYGGDETILLLRGPLAEAGKVAEDIRKTVEERVFEYQGRSFSVTISQGLAEWPRHGRTAEELIATADGALYAAKSAGRNRVCIADVDAS